MMRFTKIQYVFINGQILTMPRPQLNRIYTQVIAFNAIRNISNYGIVRLLHASFDEYQQEIIGQPVPTESTVRRYRKQEQERLLKEHRKNVPQNPLDDEWVLRPVNPDGVSPETSAWTIENILGNRLIRAIMSDDKLKSNRHMLTRRDVMWIQILREVLKYDSPVCVWSAALMYSQFEKRSELYGAEFHQKYLDDYISYRAWVNDDNYLEAVAEGLTFNIYNTSDALGHRIRLLQAKTFTMEGMERRKKEKQRRNTGEVHES